MLTRGVKFVISKISIIFAYAEVKKDTAFLGGSLEIYVWKLC